MGDITAKEVRERIERFVSEWTDVGFGIMPGYEFEHCVIDDYNLENVHIIDTLGRAAEWTEQRVTQAWADYPDMINQRLAQHTIMSYEHAALSLLHWLLTVPEETRQAATSIEYEGEP